MNATLPFPFCEVCEGIERGERVTLTEPNELVLHWARSLSRLSMIPMSEKLLMRFPITYLLCDSSMWIPRTWRLPQIRSQYNQHC